MNAPCININIAAILYFFIVYLIIALTYVVNLVCQDLCELNFLVLE